MIELAEVIAELRRELEKATAAARDAELRLELGPIELEVAVAVEREAAGAAKVRFWVVELGGDAKVTDSSTQRITVTLHPRLASSPVTPWVSGDPAAGER